MGIEPTPSAWKAEVLPLNYTRQTNRAESLLFQYQPVSFPDTVPYPLHLVVEGVGFEPTKASPADLQSAPVDRLGTPPDLSKPIIFLYFLYLVNTLDNPLLFTHAIYFGVVIHAFHPARSLASYRIGVLL